MNMGVTVETAGDFPSISQALSAAPQHSLQYLTTVFLFPSFNYWDYIMKPVIPLLLASLIRRETPQELSHDRYIVLVKQML
jgi:hypothetical protein